MSPSAWSHFMKGTEVQTRGFNMHCSLVGLRARLYALAGVGRTDEYMSFMHHAMIQ